MVLLDTDWPNVFRSNETKSWMDFLRGFVCSQRSRETFLDPAGRAVVHQHGHEDRGEINNLVKLERKTFSSPHPPAAQGYFVFKKYNKGHWISNKEPQTNSRTRKASFCQAHTSAPKQQQATPRDLVSFGITEPMAATYTVLTLNTNLMYIFLYKYSHIKWAPSFRRAMYML